MKLHLANAGGLNQITSCGVDYVAVNGVRHSASLIVTPSAIDLQWPVEDFEQLTAATLAPLLEHSPELALIGTGSRLRFPSTQALRPLIEANLGYEIMDTAAACRTYNILVAEGRRVLAALIVP